MRRERNDRIDAPRYAAEPPSRALSRSGRLVVRFADRLSAGRPLVVGPPDAAIVEALAGPFPSDATSVFTWDWAVARSLRAAETVPERAIRFGAGYEAAEPHDLALVFLPKSRALASLVFRTAAAATVPGAPVLVVGENDAGIRSCHAALEELVGPVEREEAAFHARLLFARRERAAESVDLARLEERYEAPGGGRALTVVSLPGVFSRGRLDDGTAMLLRHVEVRRGARVLDFGCGAGAVGAAVLAADATAAVDFVDSNAFALEATRRTLAANGLAASRVFPSDVFSDVTETYDAILSNPPFHEGVRPSLAVTAAFLAGARARLSRGGLLRVVANRFLPYPDLMKERFGSVTTVEETRAFRVLEARV